MSRSTALVSELDPDGSQGLGVPSVQLHPQFACKEPELVEGQWAAPCKKGPRSPIGNHGACWDKAVHCLLTLY